MNLSTTRVLMGKYKRWATSGTCFEPRKCCTGLLCLGMPGKLEERKVSLQLDISIDICLISEKVIKPEILMCSAVVSLSSFSTGAQGYNISDWLQVFHTIDAAKVEGRKSCPLLRSFFIGSCRVWFSNVFYVVWALQFIVLAAKISCRSFVGSVNRMRSLAVSCTPL